MITPPNENGACHPEPVAGFAQTPLLPQLGFSVEQEHEGGDIARNEVLRHAGCPRTCETFKTGVGKFSNKQVIFV